MKVAAPGRTLAKNQVVFVAGGAKVAVGVEGQAVDLDILRDPAVGEHQAQFVAGGRELAELGVTLQKRQVHAVAQIAYVAVKTDTVIHHVSAGGKIKRGM